MKFVCDKCKTKYSIADEKVRRKVLKIRCKSCGNIIVVRDTQAVLTPSARERVEATERSARGRGALSAAFDGAFAPRSRRVTGPSLRSVPALDEQAEIAPEAPKLDVGMEELAPPPEDEWYLAVDGNQYGPMAFSELCSRVKRGEARSETGEEVFVWRDGFDDWLEVANVPELRPYFPPPPPRTRSGLFPIVPGSDAGRNVGSAVRALPEPPSPMPPMPPLPAPPPPVVSPAPVLVAAQQPISPVGPSSYGSNIMPLPAPAAPPAAPPPELRPAEGAAEVAAALESGLRQLPSAFGAAPVASGVHTVQPTPSRTPLLLKFAAIGAIASTLIGIAFLIYFLVFFHPQKQQPPGEQPAVAAVTTPAAPAQPAEPDEPEEEPSIDFPEIVIQRTETPEKGVRRSRPKVDRATKRGAEPTPASGTAEQKRLMALYKKSGEAEVVPDSPRAQPRRASNWRRIQPSDLERVQRENARALKACYERALKRDKSLTSARVDAEIRIGDTGAVRSVRISGSDSPDLVGCLNSNLKRWVFPAIGAQTVSFPLIFRGS